MFNNLKTLLITLSSILIVFSITTLFLGSVIIETGNIGVFSRLGQIDKNELLPGWHFAIPVIEKIEPVFTKTIMINYSKQDKDKKDSEELYNEGSLEGEDISGLEMSIDMIIEIDPQKDKMSDMYIDVGREGFYKKVLQPIRSLARQVLGQYHAENIMSLRKEVEISLKDKINELFATNPYYKLINVQLKKIYLPIKVKDAIEKVQLSKQNAKSKEEEIKSNMAEAQSKVALAKGESESIKEKAKGEAEAIREKAKANAEAILIEAEAQSKANKLLSDSLTKSLLELKHINAWKDGGSKVPYYLNSDKNNNSLFMIDLNKINENN